MRVVSRKAQDPRIPHYAVCEGMCRAEDGAEGRVFWIQMRLGSQLLQQITGPFLGGFVKGLWTAGWELGQGLERILIFLILSPPGLLVSPQKLGSQAENRKPAHKKTQGVTCQGALKATEVLSSPTSDTPSTCDERVECEIHCHSYT